MQFTRRRLRDAGKTILLRQLRRTTEDALYISLDTLESDEDLCELAKLLCEDYGITAVFLNEIHYIADYASHLKRIYDFLPTRVWFTSSVALSLTATQYDLSRRVQSLVFQPVDAAIGALREEFFVLAMRQHGRQISYAKSTRGAKTPDYVLDLDAGRTVVEIGGTGKGRSQFKGFGYDRKVVLFDGDRGPVQPGKRVPLHCLGFA